MEQKSQELAILQDQFESVRRIVASVPALARALSEHEKSCGAQQQMLLKRVDELDQKIETLKRDIEDIVVRLSSRP